MYGTATGISSGDTKVQYNGTHANYCGSTGDFYRTLYHSSILPCSGLSAGTNYYAELAGSTHGTGNNTSFNNTVRSLLGVQRPNSSSTLSNHFTGYMSQFYMVDGQALVPSDFGYTDAQTGQWRPKRPEDISVNYGKLRGRK